MNSETPNPAFGEASLSGEGPRTTGDINLSGVKVSIVGCGGCGINIARNFKAKLGKTAELLNGVFYFDTSMTNSRHGDVVEILASGAGSGSDRSANASDLQREISKLEDKQLGVADVAIVIFSTAGGSGSVIGPLLIREYNRKNVRTIAVVISESVSVVGAKNTVNTLKTISAITNNNEIYLPIALFANDEVDTRGEADHAVSDTLTRIMGILTTRVYEVDKNDRLNWVNPMKVTGAAPGIKLLTFMTTATQSPCIVGGNSRDMVDSILILRKEDEDIDRKTLPLSSLIKTGYYIGEHTALIGKVSSDITPIENVIDAAEQIAHQAKNQSVKQIDRLKTSGSDELIL